MEKHVSSIVQNATKFSDKAQQVKPSGFEAFGISISSRYGKCSELIELMLFAQAAAVSAVARYVHEAEYDSKASICAFRLDPSVVFGSEIERMRYPDFFGQPCLVNFTNRRNHEAIENTHAGAA